MSRLIENVNSVCLYFKAYEAQLKKEKNKKLVGMPSIRGSNNKGTQI